MPKATVTVRELKNKDTGIDLSVTSYREIPGLVRSTFEYQIVVVSSLSCFKLPSHKESDIVQFTLFKKFPEFEDLRARLNEAFSGTAFPPLVKKSLIVNDAVIKERRNNLDAFLRFLSATPRVVTCSHVLTFLGVETQKAKRFASGETEASSTHGEGTDKEEKDEENKQEGMTSSNLFEEEEEEDGEDFLSTATSAGAAKEDNDDFFSTADSPSPSATDARLFESQDLKRELTVEDEKDFAFVPDAIITKRQVVSASAQDTENELLQVDEDIDLDKLLTLETPGAKQQQPSHPPQPKPKPSPSHPQTPKKPSVLVKPKPAAKPAIPSAKPSVPSKPGTVPSEVMPSASVSEPVSPERPVPAPRRLKPPAKAEKKKEGDRSSAGVSSSPASAKSEMTSDDIMQYIAAANAEEEDADLDLFS
ncbi:uncharacterized protein LOC143291302 [Babylonia areolata]|uniref:uncharacterized protein LOC143291302 n=1 Tax=Babylonia areolata TaxID=304850 RepID=UPI003FD647C7